MAEEANVPNGLIPTLDQVADTVINLTDRQLGVWCLREIRILQARLDHADSLARSGAGKYFFTPKGLADGNAILDHERGNRSTAILKVVEAAIAWTNQSTLNNGPALMRAVRLLWQVTIEYIDAQPPEETKPCVKS
jgi:hypothetical protein